MIISQYSQFTSTKFSLCIRFRQESSISIFVRVYCLEIVCLQTLQVQLSQSQHFIMTLKLFTFSEVFISVKHSIFSDRSSFCFLFQKWLD